MNNKIIRCEENIRNKIYFIRGVQVMLDKDLAELYEVKTIRLREQVKRNIKRFPKDFMFQLTELEVQFLVSQNAIPSKKHLGGHLPYAFTEQGIANLSSVLTNDKAIDVNINIMRTFVIIRTVILSDYSVFNRLNTIEQKQIIYDEKFEKILMQLKIKILNQKKEYFSMDKYLMRINLFQI